MKKDASKRWYIIIHTTTNLDPSCPENVTKEKTAQKLVMQQTGYGGMVLGMIPNDIIGTKPSYRDSLIQLILLPETGKECHHG